MDARKLKERATEAFAKGKFLKAAEAYAEYCAADPKDAQARLRMGDAWSKAGQKPKAIAAYQGAAETFAKDGFLPRAIAASKLILELDPAHKGVQQMLADLYARKSGGAPAAPKPPVGAVAVAAVAAALEQKVETPPEQVAPEVAIEVESAVRHSAPKTEAIDFGLVTAPAIHEAPAPVEATLLSSPPEPVPAAVPPPSVALEPAGPKVYELDLDEPEEEAVALATDLALASPAPAAVGEVDIEIEGPPSSAPAAVSALEMEIVAENAAPVSVTVPLASLEREIVALEEVPPDTAAAELAAPPGLKPKRAESAPRIWLPQGFTPPPPSAPTAPTLAAPALVAKMTAPHHAQPHTDLARSLEAFSQFDIDEQPPVDARSLEVKPAPPPAGALAMSGFTELELDGDSLLHAVEEAAAAGLSSRGIAVAPLVVEESLAHDEPKVEPGALPKIPLFSDLPEDAFIALFEKCPLRRLGLGEVIVAQGSQGDSFFVICAGSVKVFRTEHGQRRDLARLDEGAFFGEMALLSATARTASVEGNDEDTQLLEISAAILAELSEKYATVATALKKFCRQRLLQNVMGSSPLFAPFSRQERRALVEKFRAREVNKGDSIIRQGEKSDGLYIVLAGEVAVSVGPAALASLKEGEIFGEMSLLTKQPAGADVKAAKRTSLLRLPREDFDRLIMSHPQILALVSELTDERNKRNAAVQPLPLGDEPLV
ncbi:MAG: cyclic nucleotide-binding domain-containing protein, partial [Myxococcaceae bacterium]|nr:cyclic nucleotide-binding domain-containing protein [Myxococcaceae bacterium]